ncbi:hypothetical protein GCM10020220_032400 [Nonomuraea rubra]
MVQDIKERYEAGQPVLVGTTSVEKSERLSKALKRRGVPHEVLNAKNHAREASIIAEAGRKGAVTVATNMAGRGTDIMLGGNSEFRADLELRQRGLDPVETPEEYEKAYPEAAGEGQGGGQVPSTEHLVPSWARLYVVRAPSGIRVRSAHRHQLRAGSGRQAATPASRRFYLSLATA